MNTVSKKRMDALIPLAIDVVREFNEEFLTGTTKLQMPDATGNLVSTEVPAIPKTIHGYFSAFGADVVNTSPLAATIFYEQEESRSKEDRRLIPTSILALLKKDPATRSGASSFQQLQTYLHEAQVNDAAHPHSLRQTKVYIMTAAAALKIALRTFPQS